MSTSQILRQRYFGPCGKILILARRESRPPLFPVRCSPLLARVLVVFLLIQAAFHATIEAADPMFDPIIDRPDQPWCYAYRAKGGKPYPVEPPALLTPGQRQAAFEKLYDPTVCGIAMGKPVSASASLPAYPPELAVDGRIDKPNLSWQTDPYPAWLEIDLETSARIDRIHVFPYWGGQRYYRYNVEVSLDRKTWTQVVDMTRNTAVATPRGHDHHFPPIPARYVRVNMLYHNLNRGVHLVEVRVFEAQPGK